MSSRILSCAVVVTAIVLAGCTAVPGSKSYISIDVAKIAPLPPGTPRLAKVEVVDERAKVLQERTTVGNVSLGEILFVPQEPQLIRQIVAAKADQALLQKQRAEAPPEITVTVQEFRIDTPATALYWDVSTRIHARLRMRDQESEVSGEATERTYAFPSDAIIERVTTKALQQVADGTEQTMKAWLAPN